MIFSLIFFFLFGWIQHLHLVLDMKTMFPVLQSVYLFSLQLVIKHLDFNHQYVKMFKFSRANLNLCKTDWKVEQRIVYIVSQMVWFVHSNQQIKIVVDINVWIILMSTRKYNQLIAATKSRWYGAHYKWHMSGSLTCWETERE